MRLRLPELIKERSLSAYALSKRSGGRISMSTAYRLAKLSGRVQNFDAEMLEVLCEVLGVEPSELLQRERKRKPK
jgi:DNA-binding Xre family transcriptional regulator